VQTWIDSYQVNFLSTLRMSTLFLPGIKENGWGRFINISTGGAAHTPSTTEYSAAKAALNKLTADMAKDVGQYGATCNGIAPGVTHSAAVTEWLEGMAQAQGWEGDYDDWEARFVSEMAPQPIHLCRRPSDVAGAAAVLIPTSSTMQPRARSRSTTRRSGDGSR
jgi:NAD(P)-dependent dehydrogenase (short-subunit alcohol dehydrogenase family)